MTDRKRAPQAYVEETFGILTDDELYLDCVLVKPKNLTDDNLKVLRVWVPKFPLTKTSVIACARQEVQSYGANGNIAHLVFDLRGTGESDGGQGDERFGIDLKSVKAWADERFGEDINFGFLGSPTLKYGEVNMLPVRAGVVMETYHYPAVEATAPGVLYLSTFGNFDQLDDARCGGLARMGYEVHALDPMRYLLHAGANRRLRPDQLQEDLRTVMSIIGRQPYLVGMPISAGLALLWAGMVEQVPGVIAIGRAAPAFKAKHIFTRDKELFSLPQYVSQIPPRPLALVRHQKHPMGGEKGEMALLYKASSEPRRVEQTTQVSPQFLDDLLKWQINAQKSD